MKTRCIMTPTKGIIMDPLLSLSVIVAATFCTTFITTFIGLVVYAYVMDVRWTKQESRIK